MSPQQPVSQPAPRPSLVAAQVDPRIQRLLEGVARLYQAVQIAAHMRRVHA